MSDAIIQLIHSVVIFINEVIPIISIFINEVILTIVKGFFIFPHEQELFSKNSKLIPTIPIFTVPNINFTEILNFILYNVYIIVYIFLLLFVAFMYLKIYHPNYIFRIYRLIENEKRYLVVCHPSSISSISFQQWTPQLQTDDSCCMCLEAYNSTFNVVQLSCKHFHHKECLQKWFLISKVCPICRMDCDNVIIH